MIAQRADFRVTSELETKLKSLRSTAGAIGVIFLALTIVGAFMDAPQFFRSYLYSYVFWVGISVGCLNWLMVQYLSGGAWGVMSAASVNRLRNASLCGWFFSFRSSSAYLPFTPTAGLILTWWRTTRYCNTRRRSSTRPSGSHAALFISPVGRSWPSF